MNYGKTEDHECVVCGGIHSPADQAQLIEAADALTEAREVLKSVEWALADYPDYDVQCPACRGFKPAQGFRAGVRVGHAPDCLLAKVLGAR